MCLLFPFFNMVSHIPTNNPSFFPLTGEDIVRFDLRREEEKKKKEKGRKKKRMVIPLVPRLGGEVKNKKRIELYIEGFCTAQPP